MRSDRGNEQFRLHPLSVDSLPNFWITVPPNRQTLRESRGSYDRTVRFEAQPIPFSDPRSLEIQDTAGARHPHSALSMPRVLANTLPLQCRDRGG